MVNTDDFIKRLEIILDYYSINASAFADKIGVQRSSLSHLLSGRNKPSLDFIMKILEVYPEVDLYWILNGKGSFPKNSSQPSEVNPTTTNPAITTTENNTPTINEGLFFEKLTTTPKSLSTEASFPNAPSFFDETIEKIVFFYKDGTFKTFNPSPKKQ